MRGAIALATAASAILLDRSAVIENVQRPKTAKRSQPDSPGLQAWESTPATMRPEGAPDLRNPIGLFQEAVTETRSVALTGQISFVF